MVEWQVAGEAVGEPRGAVFGWTRHRGRSRVENSRTEPLASSPSSLAQEPAKALVKKAVVWSHCICHLVPSRGLGGVRNVICDLGVKLRA